MVSERTATARGVAVLPLLLMGVTHFTVTPLKEMFEVIGRLLGSELFELQELYELLFDLMQ